MQLWECAAALELPVFPCNADKTPACAHGFKDAQRDRDAIKALFQSAPQAELIGVPTGAVSGFDVLDLDIPRHPEAEIWRQSAKIPMTRVHKTKSGGYHVFFKHHPGLRNWTSIPVPGVDGRADGGYVIYWAAHGLPTNTKPIEPWPSALLAPFLPKAQPKRSTNLPTNINDDKLNGIVRAIGHAKNGERNDLLFWGACRVSEWIDAGDLTRSVGEAVLKSSGRQAGLDEIEIERTIGSAFGWKARHGDSA